MPFYGAHQAGITTPAQDRLAFASFDLTLTTQAELRDLLRTWSEAAAKLTTGSALGPAREPPAAASRRHRRGRGAACRRSDRSRSASARTCSRRTAPIGSAWRRGGRARCRPLGPLPGEELDPTRSNGDICVQACAADPVVAFHALRTLARIGRGAAVLRWTQIGFGRTSSTRKDQVTERNLMGFKDGTNNLRRATTRR